MRSDLKWPEGQVFLLYNIDPLWGQDENDNVVAIVRQIKTALEQEGHSVVLLGAGDPDIGNILTPYDPGKYIVFNWCEDLPGIQKGDVVTAGLTYGYFASTLVHLAAQRHPFSGPVNWGEGTTACL